MSKRSFAFAAAGLAVALLWTPLVTNLFPLLPTATSRLMWRTTQFFVGLLSAVVLVLPIVIALRPVQLRHGVVFFVVFITSQACLHLTFGGTTNTLLEMFVLPDMWALLGLSACLFWLASPRKVGARAA